MTRTYRTVVTGKAPADVDRTVFVTKDWPVGAEVLVVNLDGVPDGLVPWNDNLFIGDTKDVPRDWEYSHYLSGGDRFWYTPSEFDSAKGIVVVARPKPPAVEFIPWHKGDGRMLQMADGQFHKIVMVLKEAGATYPEVRHEDAVGVTRLLAITDPDGMITVKKES